MNFYYPDGNGGRKIIEIGGTDYSLPTASESIKGGVKIGDGFSMDGEILNIALSGITDFPVASESVVGGVKIGDGLEMDGDVLKCKGGGSSYSLPIASTTQLGGVKIGKGLAMDGDTLNVTLQSDSDSSRAINIKNVLKGDDAEEYVLPTASESIKGGVIIGAGLSMTGDVLNVTLETADDYSLPTASQTVKGGVKIGAWLEMGGESLKISEPVLTFSPDIFVDELKAYLPFNSSVTYDVRGNVWNTTGNPTIGAKNSAGGKALQLDGSSSLLTTDFELGGQDFTINGWAFMDSATYLDSSDASNDGKIFSVYNSGGGLVVLDRASDNYDRLALWVNETAAISVNTGIYTSANVDCVDKLVHFEVVYQYAKRLTTLYINGVQAAQKTDCPQYTRQNFTLQIGSHGFVGTVDEFKVFDGVALHTGDFVLR